MVKKRNMIDATVVKGYCMDAGASSFGIASSEDFGAAPEGLRPSDWMNTCSSVIVIGVPFPQESVHASSPEYTDIRNETCRKATAIAKDVARRIKNDGYRTLAISSLSTKISLKHAAELAGIGTIAKNYLLTNPVFGNLLWFAAVLTDAELERDGICERSICDGCSICIESCPSGALDEMPAFGKKRCSDTCWKYSDKKWLLNCWLCRTSCPYGIGTAADE